jgi:16S rRNA C967 or C1407 C5-methylase (RsmB/RsmF family)
MSAEKRPRVEPSIEISSEMAVNESENGMVEGSGPVNMRPLTDDMKGWNKRVTENADWEMYYTAQNVCSDATELNLMKEAFQAPLPVAIRVNTSAATQASVHSCLAKLSCLGPSKPNKCDQLTWSIDGNAWQWNDISRIHVRKDPSLIQLKKWFVDHENIGTLTRQEAVSMIPPIVLDPQPGETILDMCAAPGSKTCQMIESVKCQGVVVANDVEWKRANMLSHQVQRLSSPANIVVNMDACHFQGIAEFDKILCDVPCTGDGTIRKAADIWRRWGIVEGNSIHHRQFQILCRGIQLLKSGGTLVYSTCSLNPIENEAVVAAALLKFKDQVDVVPVEELPGLDYKKGLTNWKVFNDKTKEVIDYTSFLELEKTGTAGRLKATMFPPSDPEVASKMANTCRFLPHLMNTGGFYVAKFVKRINCESSSVPSAPGGKPESFGEFVNITEELYESLTSFYRIDKSRADRSQFFIRENQFRHVYFVTKEAARLLSRVNTSFKVVSVGVRAFAEIGKWDSPCPYRLTQEGVDAMAPLIIDSARTGLVSRTDLIELLETREIPTERVPALVGLAKGGGTVTDGTVRIAIMVSPAKVQVYAEKLFCEYMLNILKGVHDPLFLVDQ